MRKCLFLFIFTCATFTAFAQHAVERIGAYADSLMRLKYEPGEPGAVLLIAKDGHPVFEKGYGMANMELGIPNRTGYDFEIASNTKQFTAVCILRLVEKGKLSLSDDLHKYLPWYDTHGKHITIENLLTHTSGIPDYILEPGFAYVGQENMSGDSAMKWMGP